MKRRDFVKALPILVATPAILIPIQKEPEKHHLVALGSSATNLILKHGSKLDFKSFTIVNDLRPMDCGFNYDYFHFSPPNSTFMKIGDLRVQKPDILPYLKISPDLKSALEQKTGIITVVACLGNISGTMLYEAIGNQLERNQGGLQMLVTVPFRFEGIRRKNNAFKAIRNVEGNIFQKILNLDRLRYIHGNLSIRSAFAKADEWILETLAKNPGLG
jgi:hypothetical protein